MINVKFSGKMRENFFLRILIIKGFTTDIFRVIDVFSEILSSVQRYVVHTLEVFVF